MKLTLEAAIAAIRQHQDAHGWVCLPDWYTLGGISAALCIHPHTIRNMLEKRPDAVYSQNVGMVARRSVILVDLPSFLAWYVNDYKPDPRKGAWAHKEKTP